jgi:hypothetical protein
MRSAKAHGNTVCRASFYGMSNTSATASIGGRQSAGSTVCRNSLSRLMGGSPTTCTSKELTGTQLRSCSRTGGPGSFVEMYKIIPMLTDPTSNGLLGFRSFDVIVPSLPGFGFSRAPVRPGTSSRAVASLWHTLMAELGHSTYFAQGGILAPGLARGWRACFRTLCARFT